MLEKYVERTMEAMARELHDLPRRLPPELAGQERARLLKPVVEQLLASGSTLEQVAALLSDPALVVTPEAVAAGLAAREPVEPGHVLTR
jgi:hypothetical protein